MFNGEPFAGAADKPAGQDVLLTTDNQLLRENAKLKQELAEVKDELKRLKEIMADKDEHKKLLDQDAEFHTRYWQPDEHQRFLTGLKMYGHKDIKSIARFVGTRNSTQVRTHAQKYFMKIEKHGKTLGEIGLPERPEGCAVGASAMAKAQGVHTPTDDGTGGVRKTPASILTDPNAGSQMMVGSHHMLASGGAFFANNGSSQGAMAYASVSPGVN